MEKLKEGMYVRTNDGLIAKLIKIDTENEKYKFDNDIQWFYEYYRDDIDFDDYEEWLEDYTPKFSERLVDLIEEGDYVNGYKVDFVQYNCVVFNHNHPRKLDIHAEDIKSVVTKEQFESMIYKVGE